MIRHYKPEDAAAVKALFERQGIEAYLPLPEKDAAVCMAMVEEENGEVKRAVFARMTCEMFYVGDPAIAGDSRKILGLAARVEGGLLELSRRLREMHMGAITSVFAMVPVKFPRMNDLLEMMGFKKELEAPDFTLFYARTGEHEERRDGTQS